MIRKNLMKLYDQKKNFYRNLNMEDITDLDYNDAKRICKDFEKRKFE